MRPLPPLNALRAFEASARHLSVKLAAEELCVTAGAVSQMLKTLEAHLQTQLFHRANRRIVLTEAGQGYLPPVRNAFRQIADATGRLATATETGVLTLSVTPFFAASWLVPRLAGFRDAHPDTDLRVMTSNALADFARDGVDVAIRHGLGHYPGLATNRVVAVEIVPVAAPSLVDKKGRPRSAADLLGWPLVHDADRKGWLLWFETQRVAVTKALRGLSFDDSGLLLQAVLAGQGAGLLPSAMVARDIADGRLVRLAKDAMLERFAYYLVVPDARRTQPKIAAFRSRILGVAATDVVQPRRQRPGAAGNARRCKAPSKSAIKAPIEAAPRARR